MYTKHGYSNHPLYWVWAYMKSRCCNKNDTRYDGYGGRGITVCSEWLNNPKSFIEWALNSGWEKDLFLDREDNDGDYTPTNCRFVNVTESNVNQRKRIDNTSGFRGVHYHITKKKWFARIQIYGKRKFIGEFKTALSAALARDNYILKNQLPHPLNFAGGN